MKPTMEILEQVKQNSKSNNDEVFTRLYRYMLRPDIYYVAYKNLYANKGASTEGIDTDTADGFGEEKINRIINSLNDESYMPKPVRRTYIEKDNGKLRPLGIPTFTEKLVQEVLRMILEAVYEPVFLDCSHGFRPKRSCHSALKSMKKSFRGVRWFIEGDIKGCFDNIEHSTLITTINKKVKDMRIIKLIWKFLKAGYMENWKYHSTYSGCPQGGIISPLLSNIYLHELDKFVMSVVKDFDKPSSQRLTTEYMRAMTNVRNIKRRMDRANAEKRSELQKEWKSARAILLQTPSKSHSDKKLKYIRYADDFIIGVNGSKEDSEEIKAKLSKFIANELHMELSEEKTLITHSNDYARFLGYDVRVRRSNQVKSHSNHTQRTLSNSVELNIPIEDKIMKFMFSKGTISQKQDGTIEPVCRANLIRCTPLEIVSTYNAELRGICNYYSLASNFCSLNYFSYLMEYSCLKTLAGKHKSKIGKIKSKYKDGKGKWGIPYETQKGTKRCYIVKYSDCRKCSNPDDNISNAEHSYRLSRTTFESRLAAKECELCGTTEAHQYEIHHINKVKNLKGKYPWEIAMIAKKRKTLVVCVDCHKEIHGSKKQRKVKQ